MSAVLPLGWEQAQIDLARRTLDHIPACARAEITVEWYSDPLGPGGKAPKLRIAFPEFGIDDGRRCGVPMCEVRLFTLPGNQPVSGDRLREHLPQRVDAFLTEMAKGRGVVLDQDTDQEHMVLVKA